MASNLLFPGADMLENFLQNMADKIIAMVDEILTEKADAMIYDIMQPKIEECLKAIFSSSPVQLEASKMFNKEIFPLYDRSLKDFAGAKQLIDEAENASKTAFDKYTEEVVNASKKGGDATTAIQEAKKKFKEEMKKISDEKIKYDAEGGGKLRKILSDEANVFKVMDDATVVENYLTNPGAAVMDALSEIINKTETTYKKLKNDIEEAEKAQNELEERRASNLRIPGISACPAIKAMYENERSKSKELIENETNKLDNMRKERAEMKNIEKDLGKDIEVANAATKMSKSKLLPNSFENKGGKSAKRSRKHRKRTSKSRN